MSTIPVTPTAGDYVMSLDDQHVAILVEDDYQELELQYPRLRLLEAGMRVSVVSAGKPGYASARGYAVTANANAEFGDPAHGGDEEVVRDGNLIRNRTPDDLPAFCRRLLEALG
jgi:putative intracellular protease/amidase